MLPDILKDKIGEEWTEIGEVIKKYGVVRGDPNVVNPLVCRFMEYNNLKYFFRLRDLLLDPKNISKISRMFHEYISVYDIQFTHLTAMLLRGSPIVYGLSLYRYMLDPEKYPQTTLIVRKDNYCYKKKRYCVDGKLHTDKRNRALVVTDTVDDGQTTLRSIEALRSLNIEVDTVLALIDNCSAEGRKELQSLGCMIFHIYTPVDLGLD